MAMIEKLRNRYFWALDLVLLPLTVYFSFVLRLENFDPTAHGFGLLILAFSVTAAILLLFHWAGIYSRYWLYASSDEFVLLAGLVLQGVVLATAFTLLVLQLLPIDVMLPRSIPFITLLLLLVFIMLPRVTARMLRRYLQRQQQLGTAKNVVIMGAGSGGALILTELKDNHQLGLTPVGFLDDDPLKQNLTIQGIPVLGNRYDIQRVVNTHHVSLVIIAMPSASGKDIREIVQLCDEAGVSTKTIPGLFDLIAGTVSVTQLRDVAIEDLLRRDSVKIDQSAVHELMEGKRVLITGGGGSIGSELVRQIFNSGPAEIAILGHGENSVFEIQNEIRGRAAKGLENTPLVSVYIADIRFPDRIKAIFQEVKPQIVFHAAAHKHVPLMEANPTEAVYNNVLGTRNLLDAALEADVERFVMISTDKAVNPTSIMGASKRAAELLVHRAAAKSGKPYVAVRFGNVLGSRGSVVLTFKKQIAAGGPVTVTDPEMQRYFMTIPEAVQLVLQAAVLGRGGEVFMLNMGEPVKIVDLATDLIRLSGLRVGRDIDIVFTGMRPGEKLVEELFIAGETYHPTRHDMIFIAGHASTYDGPDLESAIHLLKLTADHNDRAGIIRAFQQLIPEYRPQQTPAQHVAPAHKNGTKALPASMQKSAELQFNVAEAAGD